MNLDYHSSVLVQGKKLKEFSGGRDGRRGERIGREKVYHVRRGAEGASFRAEGEGTPKAEF